MPVHNTALFLTAPGGSVTMNSAGIRQDGPLSQCEIRVDLTRASALQTGGTPVPPGVAGSLLVDTGASMTAIEEDILIGLGIPEVGELDVCLAHGTAAKRKIYACGIAFSGSDLPSLDQVYVIGTNLKQQKIVGLLGRDVLALGVLIYNGSAGSWDAGTLTPRGRGLRC